MLNIPRIHTLLRVFCRNLRGDNIGVGKNTVISRNAKLVGKNITIGNDCYVSCFTFLDSSSGDIEIGNKTTIGRFCVIHGGTKIGNAVRIASHVAIIPSDHNFKIRDKLIKDQGAINRGIEIESDVWIAAGVKILSGSIITEGCVIGAGALVKSKLEPFGIYVGTPVKKISERA